MSEYLANLPECLKYHTNTKSARNCIEHLKRINPKLDENNYLTYAFLATNPELTDEEREILKKRMLELWQDETPIVPIVPVVIEEDMGTDGSHKPSLSEKGSSEETAGFLLETNTEI